MYNKAILNQIFGDVVNEMPVILFTDCKNLFDAIHSTCLVSDSWLVPDIAMIKEAKEQGTVTAIKRVLGKDMIANCLTKTSASAEDLMDILHSGNYQIPTGEDETT